MRKYKFSELESKKVNDAYVIREQELKGISGVVSHNDVVANRIRRISVLLKEFNIPEKYANDFLKSPYVCKTGYGADEEFNTYLKFLRQELVEKAHSKVELERAYLNSMYKHIELSSEYLDYSESSQRGMGVLPDKSSYYKERIQEQEMLMDTLGKLLRLKKDLERAKAAGESTNKLVDEMANLMLDIEEKLRLLDEQEKEAARKVA